MNTPNTFLLYGNDNNVPTRIIGPIFQNEIAQKLEDAANVAQDQMMVVNEEWFKEFFPLQYMEVFQERAIDFLWSFFASRADWLGEEFTASHDDNEIFNDFVLCSYVPEQQEIIVSFHVDSDPWLKSRFYYELFQYLLFTDVNLIEEDPYYIDNAGEMHYGKHIAGAKLVDLINNN